MASPTAKPHSMQKRDNTSSAEGKVDNKSKNVDSGAHRTESTDTLQKQKEHDVSVKTAVQFVHIETPSGSLQSISNLDGISSTTDEVGTLISSLDGKALSLGGKSSASIATFAMDEKESLRPDDSASIAAAAAEEDDDVQGQAVDPANSSNGSNEDVRAFREQLNEICAIDPLRRSTAAGINQEGAPAQGVLYVPDMGHVPIPAMLHQAPSELFELLPDAKLLEALENPRDRIWVLKLEQDVIDFVKDAKESSLVLPQCNSFYRMLAHKIAEYYMLGHSVDDSNSAVRLFKTPTCRIPPPLTGVVTPSTAASTPPPSLQMKILRRGMDISGPAIANGSNMPSKSTSEAAESCNDDDPRKPITREEREARYEAARLRIMGSAKPVETSDALKDESRSSSVSGKKGRKSRRENSDDDFEARSAYDSFIAPGGYPPQQYMHNGSQPMSPTHFPQSYPQMAGYPQYPAQSVPGQYWYPSMQSGDGIPDWPQSQPAYDLAREFDRSMSLQQTPSAYSAPQSPYGQTSFQQSFSQPYGWSQNGSSSNGYSSPVYQMHPTYNDRPSSSASQPQQPAYAYGQLPSQALGRPPNALEHPLPGSYKSRHFNPQSQAFVPGHNNGMFRPFQPQRTMSGPNGSAQNGLERQMSSHPALGSPTHAQHGTITARLPPHSLTHPLPQPVFPSHLPPAVSLPPKPIATQRISHDASKGAPSMNAVQQNESTIAKWDTPASLPPKPPPAAEKHDAVKVRPVQSSYNMPSFGSMPANG